LALWKVISEEDAVLIPKNWGENFSSQFLHSDFFGAGWAAMPPLNWLLLCLWVIVIQPGQVHGHQPLQEIIWFTQIKFQKLLRRLAPLTFLIRVQAFWDPLRGVSACPNLHEWWTQPAHVRCPVAQLLI
jgi:hypothetical protein